MLTWTERHALAQHRVAEGQSLIERQRALIRSQTLLGNDTTEAEELLAKFERSQAVFEHDLARIVAERE
jgi:hypothetical protein